MSEVDKGEGDRRSEESTERGFDLGRVSRTRHFRSGLSEAARAALQLMRISEITALPAVANHTSLMAEGLSGAIRVLADYERWACASLAVRFATSGSDVVLKGFFTRSRVALLEMEQVRALREMVEGEIDHAEPRCRAPGDRTTFWQGRFRSSVEILSRLTLRLTPAEVDGVLSRAVALYCREWPAIDRHSADEMTSLFARAIESLPEQDLNRRLPELAGLPIAGGADPRRDPRVEICRDPLSLVGIRKATEGSLRPYANEPAWRKAVTGLLADAKAGPADRSVAISRLNQLRHWGLLHEEDLAGLAEVLWDPSNLLPDGMPGGLDLPRGSCSSCPSVCLGRPPRHSAEGSCGTKKALPDGTPAPCSTSA